MHSQERLEVEKTPTESVEIKNQYCPDFCIPKPKSLNVHWLLDYEENFSLCKLKQIKKMLHYNRVFISRGVQNGCVSYLLLFRQVSPLRSITLLIKWIVGGVDAFMVALIQGGEYSANPGQKIVYNIKRLDLQNGYDTTTGEWQWEKISPTMVKMPINGNWNGIYGNRELALEL